MWVMTSVLTLGPDGEGVESPDEPGLSFDPSPSAVPSGLARFSRLDPTLKRWAIAKCPSGTIPTLYSELDTALPREGRGSEAEGNPKSERTRSDGQLKRGDLPAPELRQAGAKNAEKTFRGACIRAFARV